MCERCEWCKDNGIVEKYHDDEWGIPIHDDKKQFEFLMMEVMQCGLNWTMMLKKREIFKKCFDNFDFNKIVKYNEIDIEKIMNTDGMIKSIRKINAVINNAKIFLDIRNEFGSFDNYIWKYTDNHTLVYKEHINGSIPAKNELSDEISNDLKKRGFKYLGSITVYAHLQAAGMINDHHCKCYKYSEIIKRYPIKFIE